MTKANESLKQFSSEFVTCIDRTQNSKYGFLALGRWRGEIFGIDREGGKDMDPDYLAISLRTKLCYIGKMSKI